MNPDGNDPPVMLGGTVSVAQQKPWIQSKTIKENILMNLPFDEARYRKALWVC